jgi:hypothetical protein
VFDARGWEPDGAMVQIWARADGDGWNDVTEIRFDLADGETPDLSDPQRLLEERFEQTYFRIEMPRALSATIGDEPEPEAEGDVPGGARTGARQLVIAVPRDSFADMGQAEDDRD